jgi:hypothetical protein
VSHLNIICCSRPLIPGFSIHHLYVELGSRRQSGRFLVRLLIFSRQVQLFGTGVKCSCSTTNITHQEFTSATAQMACSKQPTIPFVLLLYEKMNMHILTTINNKNAHLKIRQGARVAQEKVLKYKIKAETNQFYTIATGALSLNTLVICCLYLKIEYVLLVIQNLLTETFLVIYNT